MGMEILITLQNIEKLLKAQNLQQREVLTLEEAAEYLSVSESHLYKLTSGKEIPCSKPTGKKLYFKREELNEWMLSNRILTNNEVDKQASAYMVANL